MRPVRIRSSARPRPTMRGRRWVPPSISGTPQRRSGKPRVEPSAAIRRSHHSASSRPPARHQPGDGGDRGLGRREAREAERALRGRRGGPEGLDRLEVGAGAERDVAGAGEHEHARLVVGLEAAVAVAQRLGGRAVDRVAALRAVDREQDGGGADALVADRLGERGWGGPCAPSGANRRPLGSAPEARPCYPALRVCCFRSASPQAHNTREMKGTMMTVVNSTWSPA